MRWRRTRSTMTCEQVAARVTDYLDGALTTDERVRFERHLERCEDCRAFAAQFAQTVNALGGVRADEPDPVGLDALLEAFRAYVG